MAQFLNKDVLATLVAALPDAALSVMEGGTIVAANDSALKLFISPVIGSHITSVLRSPAVLQALNATIASEQPITTQAVLRGTVDLTLDVHVAEVGRDESGKALLLLVCKDITYAQQLEKMRSDFVANASHELRTPLTTLSGFIETMQGAARQDEKARTEFLKLMKAQADRMARLIDDLLSLSRVEVSEHVAPDQIVDLSTVARMAANLLAPLAEEISCIVKLDLPERLNVLGDENQLGQVVHNLLENAIRYSGKGKTVTLRGHVESGTGILSIIDNGPGIAAHHVPRLTERFYRVNAQDSRMRGGTGLGLAICKHIINRHRGRLIIESELGKGSSFSIHLPVAK
jgi:two-component system, OmpR family, phosphate regulon sensor histidine kinase PhoR